ncbi:MAG TPA: DUF933 domain-containing protein [Patescibacteria group bacterium]|nr:DUF933 domain-containing protein [Patescibacteria group bacterium]
MSFSVGIVGLPNVGKSTLFKALTRIKVDIKDYPFTTIHPNVGIIKIPDERLDKIASIIKPEKISPTVIEFIDIAGLVKGAHKGEGLGNQFLAQIRNCQAILEVIKGFENKNAANVADEINPERDIETIKTELELKDLEIEERKLSSSPSIKIQESSEKENLLSEKPIIYLLNTDGRSRYQAPKDGYLEMNLKEEEEISELSAEEKDELKVQSKLDRLIIDCYNILDLITFFTVAGLKETRAWTLKKGSTVRQAAGLVHSDFQEKFIKAEVINWQKLVEAGSWHKARELGWLRIAGQDYLVQDGDVIEFKI